MNDFSLDPEMVRRAKELAAGPLGREMAKLPLRYAKAAFIAEPPVSDSEPMVNHGTVSLIDFGDGPIAVTCSHVLDKYRQRLKENQQTIFQIGNLRLDPLEAIIDESQALDLVTIDLREEKIDEIADGGEIGSCFFRPRSWPPRNIIEGDFVAFGGFPRKWRRQASPEMFDFGSFSSGASRVTSVRGEYFVCQFERQYWIESQGPYLPLYDIENGKDLYDFGGLSGGPVFILRQGELYPEFVGIIYEYCPLDLMKMRPAKFISENGSISTP